MWEQSKVLFVTLNVPGGSNNDADNWFGLARTQPADRRDRRTDRRPTCAGSMPPSRRRRTTTSKRW